MAVFMAAMVVLVVPAAALAAPQGQQAQSQSFSWRTAVSYVSFTASGSDAAISGNAVAIGRVAWGSIAVPRTGCALSDYSGSVRSMTSIQLLGRSWILIGAGTGTLNGQRVRRGFTVYVEEDQNTVVFQLETVNGFGCQFYEYGSIRAFSI